MTGDLTSATVIVVGVQQDQTCTVVDVAAQFAHRFGAALVCVTVDLSLLSAGTRSDGSEIVEAIDPDVADSTPQGFPDGDRIALERAARRHGVAVEVLTRVGDPARALAGVAEERDAVMIVVGTQTGRRRVAEFFNGSVAARLTHQQHRPVLVVPMEPVGFDEPLPWDAS